MRKMYAMAALVMGATQMTFAANEGKGEQDLDSLKIEEMQEVVVSGVKVQNNGPFAVSEVNRKSLESFSKSGQELPFLFARTPGVTAWSENGLGTGTTYMRIRGAADSRINITLDGVPLNSPEDQCVFWANMNSYASLLGNVQIQRGVGTSSNGDGAFGGTVAMTSKFPNTKPSLELTGSYGSYNTYNVGGSFSTGLLWNHLILDGAYHHTGTDGYIHGTDGNSGSYYAGLTYVGNDGNVILRYKNFGNYEHTGQAWNGVTAGNDDYSMNAYDGVRTYDELYKAGYGRYNNLYELYRSDYDADWNAFIVKDANGKYVSDRYMMADGTPWKRTTDNFNQNHNLLSVAWQIDNKWSTAATLHYTYGYGYYDEFRYNNKLSKFGLPVFTLSDGSSLKKTDFVRQKGLEQHTYGLVWNTSYKGRWADIVGGLSLQQFEGNHFGRVTYIANDELRAAYLADGRYTYYDSDASKGDMSAYLKGNFHVTRHFDIFADMQYRYVNYHTSGINDRFYSNGDGTYTNHQLNIAQTYNFFNPKAGLSYHKNGHNVYASFAMSHREPERNNFTDNGSYPAPRAERLLDYEAGYNFQNARWHVGANLYYMDYAHQFVQTGAVSDIGEPLTTNIKDSYRMGVELTAGVNVTKWLSLEANAALSQNKIKDFDEVVETYDAWWGDLDPTTVHYDNSTLAFSPSAIVNGFVDFHHKGFSATWHTNFVSKQYMDNSENDLRSLPKYSQTNIYLNYDLKCCKKGLKNVIFGLNFNNIFNKHYASSGYAYSAIVGDKYHKDNRYYALSYVPMAGFTMMGNITLKF